MNHIETISTCEERFDISFIQPSKDGETFEEKTVFEKTICNHGLSVDSLKESPFDIKAYIEDIAKENKLPSCDVFVQITYEQDGEYVDSDEVYFTWDSETKALESEYEMEKE